MFRILLIVTCITVISTSLADVIDDETLVIKTATATFRGKRVQVNPYQLPNYHASVAAYTKIPYAEPPVGDLRFQGPVPKVIEGDFDATSESIACRQVISPFLPLGLEQSEDCLYVDVFVPEPKPSSVAVMVWIHGGGFVVGAGSIPESPVTALVAMNDVIVVTMNYRLNVLGFLGTGEEESPFNLGMLDQVQVLLWIQENIAAFGGDPTLVTIFGESAGSMSVGLHVLSPMSAGLFSGAIMQSGTPINSWSSRTAEEGSNVAFRFGKAMNCTAITTQELVACLRERSSDDIENFFAENPMAGVEYPVGPTIDGKFLPRYPSKMSADGEVNKAAIMVGCLEDEGNLFIVPALFGMEGTDKLAWNKTSLGGLVAMLTKSMDELLLDTTALFYISPEDLAKPEPDYADAAAHFAGDWMFLCDTFAMSADLSEAGNSVYTYVMTHVPSSSIWGKDLDWVGASHGEDIPYVFGSPFMLENNDPDRDSKMTGSFNEEEIGISQQIMKYWSNFAKTGDPNLSSKDDKVDSHYPTWPAFTKEGQQYKDLSMTFDNRAGNPIPQRCSFHRDLLPKLLENAAEMARLKSLLEEKVNADSGKSCEDPASCPEE